MTDTKTNFPPLISIETPAGMKSKMDEGDEQTVPLQIDVQHYRNLVRTFIDMVSIPTVRFRISNNTNHHHHSAVTGPLNFGPKKW